MSVNIPTAFVEQYKANVTHALQQKGSRLRRFCREEDLVGEFGFYDQIGSVDASKHTTRHGDTQLSNTPHTRRRVGSETWDYADLVDREDKLKTLYDPTNPYAVAATYALGRSIDECIIEAAFGTAYTGKKGEVPVAFPESQKIVVDVEQGGTPTGLTIEKLILARETLILSEIDEDEAQGITLACTQKQISDLLRDEKATSADYAAIKALVKGEINTFMGFNFVRTNKVTKATNTRQLCAFTKTGILLAMPDDIHVDIGPRRDKRNATQVFAALTCGATRMDEEKVVMIECNEA